MASGLWEGLTLGRRTRVRFDVAEEVLVEPPYCMERSGAEIGRGAFHSCEGVACLSSAGWELASSQNTVDPQCVFSPNVLSENLLAIAEGFVELEQHFGAPVLGGTSRDLFLQKQVAAGGNWKVCLDSDQEYFPSPYGEGGDSLMDRVAVSSSVLQPDQALLLRFFIPGHRLQRHDKILTLYFSGPAGCNEDLEGVGQYAVVLYGNGKAELYEYGFHLDSGDKAWQIRTRFQFSRSTHVNKFGHCLSIYPLPFLTASGGHAGSIVFVCSQSEIQGSPSYDPLELGKSSNKESVFTYVVPVRGKRFSLGGPLRVDVKRDLRPLFQVSRLRYAEKGVIQDSPFCLPFYPTERCPLRLEWFGHVPEGCRITGRLIHAQTGEALKVLSDGEGFTEYSVEFPANSFYAEFTLEGDGRKTPFLYRYRVLRNACVQEVSSGEFEVPGIREIQIRGSEEGPGHEEGELVFDCDGASFERLKGRAYVPIQIETCLDQGFSCNPIIFKGYLLGTSVEQLSITSSLRSPQSASLSTGLHSSKEESHERVLQHGHADHGKVLRCRCTLVGMWHRLRTASVPVRFDWSVDPRSATVDGDFQPYKVTDVIRSLLGWAGFSEETIDIPDLPVRLWASDGWHHGYLLEPYTCLGDAIAQFAQEYLGTSVYYDVSQGRHGKWRLRSPLNASGESLARFVSDPRYRSASSSPQTACIRKQTRQTWTRPPRANHLCVTGLGGVKSDGTLCRLTQILVNPVSYDFARVGRLDVTHPDYMGGAASLHILDPSLNTEEAINWAAKRYYDLFCHSKRLTSFEAPLLLVKDSSSGNEGRLRLLRKGDVVEIDSEKWVLVSCSPFYTKDVLQMALYECEKRIEA